MLAGRVWRSWGIGCETSGGLAAEDWLKGVVEARRNVLVPLERGLWQGLALVRFEHGHWVTGSRNGHGGFFHVLSVCFACFACFAGFLALLALLACA